MIKIEACVDSCETAVAAELAGADRLELNCALSLDGLTPSAGLVGRVLKSVRIPVICMVRARAGNFRYNDDEWETMLQDARWLLDAGAAGLAFGCLDQQGHVDEDRCLQMRQLSAGAELVFHKAFDETASWEKSLDQLIESGINRVMSSGHHATALAGSGQLEGMVQRSRGRIEVLPAGGIRQSNAVEIVRRTGCHQIHGSFRNRGKDSPAEIGAEIEGTRAELSKESDTLK